MLKPKYKLSRGPAFTFSLLDAHRCCLTQGCRTCSPFAKCGLRGHFKRFATLDSGYAVHGPSKSGSHFCVGATAFFCYFRHPRCFRSADNEYEQENTRKGCYCHPEGNTWNTLTCTLRVKNGGRDAGPRVPSYDEICRYWKAFGYRWSNPFRKP